MANKKTSSKSSTTKSSIPKLEVDANSNIAIRQIKNGFIVSESGQRGKGKNQQWYSEDYYAKTRKEVGEIVSKGVGGVKFGGKK